MTAPHPAEVSVEPRMADDKLSNELPGALIDAHLGLAYKSSGLNGMTGESWDRIVARRFFALGMATAAGLIEIPAGAAALSAPQAAQSEQESPLMLPPEGWCSLERAACGQRVWDEKARVWASMFDANGRGTVLHTPEMMEYHAALERAYRLVISGSTTLACYDDHYNYVTSLQARNAAPPAQEPPPDNAALADALESSRWRNDPIVRQAIHFFRDSEGRAGVALPAKTALERFNESAADLANETPLERLRYFLSLALNGQDWLDVEPFLDALGVPEVDRG
jgi:hypothetical protein